MTEKQIKERFEKGNIFRIIDGMLNEESSTHRSGRLRSLKEGFTKERVAECIRFKSLDVIATNKGVDHIRLYCEVFNEGKWYTTEPLRLLRNYEKKGEYSIHIDNRHGKTNEQCLDNWIGIDVLEIPFFTNHSERKVNFAR